MLTLQVMACIGIIVGFFLMFRIRLNDFAGNIFRRILRRPKGIREEILEETKQKKKSFLRREIEEAMGDTESHRPRRNVPVAVYGVFTPFCRRSC